MIRVPRQVLPTGLVREYTRELVGLVARTRTLFQPVASELPALLSAVRRERVVKTDAGEGRRVSQLLDTFRAAITLSISDDHLFGVAERFAGRLSEHNRRELARQSLTAIGVDLFADDSGMQSELEGFVTRNVALIRDIPATVATKVERLVTDGIARGTLWRDIAPDITGEWRIGRKRAQLIARDQVLTGYGRINVTRQKAAGLAEADWLTSGDRRVRGTPGGAFPNAKPSHHALNGLRFKLNAPPHGELPGEPVLCRCQAIPVFSGF